MSLQNIGIGVAVVLSVIAIALGIVGFGGSHPAGNLTQTNLQTNAPANATSFVGPYGVESDAGFFDAAGAASSLLGSLTLDGASFRNYVESTSTVSTSMTMKATDIENYSTVIATPNVGALTYTFPASSTLSAYIPSAGEFTEQCWYNATGTAAATITFVAGTGETLTTASTTAAGGTANKTIAAQDTGCFKYIRNGGTASKGDDISIQFTAFQ